MDKNVVIQNIDRVSNEGGTDWRDAAWLQSMRLRVDAGYWLITCVRYSKTYRSQGGMRSRSRVRLAIIG